MLRNENAAILVGVGTVLKDNPELTTRIPNVRNPVRVILDSTLKIPLDSKVVLDKKSQTWVFTSQAHSIEKRKKRESLRIQVFVTSGTDRVYLFDTLKLLRESSISSLLIESGGEVNASFIEQKLVDKVVLYIAPKLIGGSGAPTFLDGMGINKMGHAIELADVSLVPIGRDYKFVGYPQYE